MKYKLKLNIERNNVTCVSIMKSLVFLFDLFDTILLYGKLLWDHSIELGLSHVSAI